LIFSLASSSFFMSFVAGVKNSFCLLLLCCWVFVLQAQKCDFIVSGRVQALGQPMPNAHLLIVETQQGLQSDAEGRFSFNGLCEGEYTLSCTHLNCEHLQQKIVIKHNERLDISLNLHTHNLEQVLVQAQRNDIIATKNSLSGADLVAAQGIGLGESLRRLPGVAILNTGASIAKPVIQGLHSNRIVLFNNGVRQEGQQWGAEHAPEIDPFASAKITVVRGAASVRYGADALGGVLLFEPQPIRSAKGLGGELQMQGFSNGRGGVVSGMLEGPLASKLPLFGRVQGTLKRQGNLHTPDYFLNNTGLSESNFSWTARYQPKRGFVETYYSRFYNQLGILSDAHIGNLTDLQNAIDRGRPLDNGQFTYDLGRPQQRVLHELFKLKGAHELKQGQLSFQVSRQFNRRQEYDAHRRFNPLPETLDEPSIEFELTTWAAELAWEYRRKHWRGSTGLNSQHQRNTTDRGALLPNYQNLDWGIFWTESWRKNEDPWQVEFGLRYDQRHLETSTQGNRILEADRNFSGFSGNLGASYHFSSSLLLRYQLGTAWRSPHVSELFSNGVHHGTASFEAGNANLQAERAFKQGLSLEWKAQNRQHNANLSLYYNLINDFIYLEPQAQAQLSIRGAFPAFAYAQNDARIMGLDWTLQLDLGQGWFFEQRLALIQGWNRNLNDYLVYMPPLRIEQGMRWYFKSQKEQAQNAFVRLNAQWTAGQNMAPATDFAPPPSGYFRLDTELFYPLKVGKQNWEMGLSALNMLNARYRDYLDRLRYFAQAPGRNVALRLKIPL
jgi:iron complex outermembrane recepter protein